MPRQDVNSSGAPTTFPVRPNISRHASVNTILKVGTSASPRHATSFPNRTPDQGARQRFSSLPITTSAAKPPDPQAAPRREETTSPDLAESSSNESSDDESSPAQSRIIRRPPRLKQQNAAENYQDDGDEESEPAFQPYQASSDQKGQDLASTLKGHEGATWRTTHRSPTRDAVHQSQTSDDSSTGSSAAARQQKSREPKMPGLLSPRQNTELAGKSPSQEGSEGTPSMGSSYSDLDGLSPSLT